MRTWQPGELFADRYRIESRLGEGGFSVVWAATDTTGRPVALKLLKSADAVTRRRFDREAAILGTLKDPHTVAMLDAGESADGIPYIVLELVEGRDLAEYLDSVGYLAPQWVVHILRQLLSSLREAHQAGLVHRDIKPENIRIFEHAGDPMTAKLLDFGIARPTDDGTPSVTSTGDIIGTPRYMSPEQLYAEPVTARSDLYSLGLVALEALFGSEVLSGHSLGAQLDRLRFGTLTPPDSGRIDPELLAVITRMTALDAEARYPTAAAVLAALRDIGEPHAAPKPSPLDATAAPSPRPRPAASGPTEPSPAAVSAPPVPAQPVRAGPPTRVIGVVVAIAIVAVLAVVAAGSTRTPADERSPAPATRREVGGLVRGTAARAPDSPVAAPVVAPVVAPDSGSADAGPVTGCGLKPDEFKRRFRGAVHLPARYDSGRAHPLVVLLHPATMSPGEFASKFQAFADRDRFVLIAPKGGVRSWSDVASIDDIKARVEHTRENLCIDANKIFVVGQADGAALAWQATCQDWVAGGVAAGYLPRPGWDHCDPLVAKPFLMLLPTKSTHAPIGGGVSCTGKPKMSAADAEKLWRAANGCSSTPTTTKHPGGTCFAWTCATPFESCHLDGGRDWPGTEQQLDIFKCNAPAPDFASAEKVWEFFADVVQTAP